jgi:hypothetical protein
MVMDHLPDKVQDALRNAVDRLTEPLLSHQYSEEDMV